MAVLFTSLVSKFPSSSFQGWLLHNWCWDKLERKCLITGSEEAPPLQPGSQDNDSINQFDRKWWNWTQELSLFLNCCLKSYWLHYYWALGYIIIGLFPKPIFAILSQTFALVGKLFTGFNDAMASQKWQISGMVISLFFFQQPRRTLWDRPTVDLFKSISKRINIVVCVCDIMYLRLACGQREFHCWEALTWKGRGASHDWGHVSHFLCINIAPRRFLFYKIRICALLQICCTWCPNLGESELSFVSRDSSSLNGIQECIYWDKS